MIADHKGKEVENLGKYQYLSRESSRAKERDVNNDIDHIWIL